MYSTLEFIPCFHSLFQILLLATPRLGHYHSRVSYGEAGKEYPIGKAIGKAVIGNQRPLS